MGDSFLLSFNFQCRDNDNKLDYVSQHESPMDDSCFGSCCGSCCGSPNFKCSSDNFYGYKLDGDCPYIGWRLLKKVRPANENDDYIVMFSVWR